MKREFIVRDTRNGEWLWVYNALIADPHLEASDKVVYAAIASFGGCDEIHPSVELLSKRSSVKRRTVISCVKRLIDTGYISVEKGGGRGRANVYLLLKQPKGCKQCTVSQTTQTVQRTTLNSATDDIQTVQPLHPNKIIELDKEKDNLATQASRDVEEVISLFESVNPSYKKMFANKTQRSSVSRLLVQWPRPQLDKIIAFLPQTNKEKYAPTITTPLQLEDKIGTLIAFVKKSRETSNVML